MWDHDCRPAFFTSPAPHDRSAAHPSTQSPRRSPVYRIRLAACEQARPHGRITGRTAAGWRRSPAEGSSGDARENVVVIDIAEVLLRSVREDAVARGARMAGDSPRKVVGDCTTDC